MTIHEEIRRLEESIAGSEALASHSPDFVAATKERLLRLGAERHVLAVAGAQGTGKSSLVTALVATVEEREPPVPVSELEETRIPLILRRGVKHRAVEVWPRERRVVIEDALPASEVRRRVSASREHGDPKFSDLMGLELESPDFGIPRHLDLIDLPGVAGNLAGVSEWARQYLLAGGVQCMVFVVSSGQTIDSCEAEARLIEAFGPHMLRTVFVQNVWSGYDDPIEEVRRKNLEFLKEHAGSGIEENYVLMDIATALAAAKEGDSSQLAELGERLRPFLESDVRELYQEESLRLLSHLDGLRTRLEQEVLVAEGGEVEREEQRGKLKEERKQASSLKRRLLSRVGKRRGKERKRLLVELESAVSIFQEELTAFVEGDRSVTQVTLERKIARLLGSLNKTVSAGFATSVQGLHSEVRNVLETAETDGLLRLPRGLQLKAPRIKLQALRQVVRRIPRALALAGGGVGIWAGAKMGAGLGAYGGPVGAGIGLLVGAALGWGLGKLSRKHLEKGTLGRKQARSLEKEMKKELDRERAELKKALADGLDEHASAITKRVMSHFDERLSGLAEKATGLARGSTDARELLLHVEEVAALGEAVIAMVGLENGVDEHA